MDTQSYEKFRKVYTGPNILFSSAILFKDYDFLRDTLVNKNLTVPCLRIVMPKPGHVDCTEGNYIAMLQINTELDSEYVSRLKINLEKWVEYQQNLDVDITLNSEIGIDTTLFLKFVTKQDIFNILGTPALVGKKSHITNDTDKVLPTIIKSYFLAYNEVVVVQIEKRNPLDVLASYTPAQIDDLFERVIDCDKRYEPFAKSIAESIGVAHLRTCEKDFTYPELVAHFEFNIHEVRDAFEVYNPWVLPHGILEHVPIADITKYLATHHRDAYITKSLDFVYKILLDSKGYSNTLAHLAINPVSDPFGSWRPDGRPGYINESLDGWAELLLGPLYNMSFDIQNLKDLVLDKDFNYFEQLCICYMLKGGTISEEDLEDPKGTINSWIQKALKKLNKDSKKVTQEKEVAQQAMYLESTPSTKLPNSYCVPESKHEFTELAEELVSEAIDSKDKHSRFFELNPSLDKDQLDSCLKDTSEQGPEKLYHLVTKGLDLNFRFYYIDELFVNSGYSTGMLYQMNLGELFLLHMLKVENFNDPSAWENKDFESNHYTGLRLKLTVEHKLALKSIALISDKMVAKMYDLIELHLLK
jgi:hypothetical protein